MRASAPELKGEIAQRYAVEGELGRGATAIVYRARDRARGMHVAIKMLRDESLGSMSVDRFLAEIQRTTQLTHSHIVPVLDSGEHQGRPFFVLPYMDGGTLRERLLRAKQLPLEEAISLGVTIARALDFAHAQGVIHRDVKPENILYNNGQPCLADFGTARALERAANDPTTSTGIVRGTAAYMSPEQASGEREYDGRTDIYSLGCVLYEAVAGIQPFVGPTVQAVISQRLSHSPRPVSIYRPSVPPELEQVLAKATAMSPADRYQSGSQLAAALEAAAPSLGYSGSRASRTAKSRWIRASVASAVVVAAIAIGVAMVTRSPLDANDWMLVADFSGPAADPTLAPAVRDLATEAFRQSRFVQVFDRRQLNEVMRRASVPETTTVTAARAREFAVRSSVSAVLQGSVNAMDSGRYDVVLHVVRAEDGETIASAVRTASLGELPQMVQEAVDELRSRVGEHRDAVRSTRPLRDVATPSFAAFRLYSASIDLVLQKGDVRGGNQLLHDAVALDTGFASAWAAMAVNYTTLRELDSARIAMNNAIARPNRLSAAELYRLKGDMAFTLDHDPRAAVQWYDRYVAEAPHLTSGLSNRGLYKTAMGRYAEALPDLEAAATMNPFGAALSQPQLLNYGAILVLLRRYDDARRVADSLTGWPADYLRTLIPMGESRWAAAESAAVVAERNTAAPSVLRLQALTSHASALAGRGALAAADSLLVRAVNESRGSMARWFERARLELAMAGAVVPRRTDLLAKDTTPAGAVFQALWTAVAGDTTRARSLLAGVRMSPAQVSSLGASQDLVLAWIDLHAGNPRRAIDRLGPVALAGEHDPISLDRPDQFILRWSVARAYERIGRTDSALAYLRLLSQPSGMPPRHLSLRGLMVPAAEARISQLQGRSR